MESRIGRDVGTLYVGVTNNPARRVYEHRTEAVAGFSRRYAVHRLVYHEQFDQIEFAIRREKRLKKWDRAWKVELIEKTNPNWIDLYFRDCRSVSEAHSPRPVVTGSPGRAGR